MKEARVFSGIGALRQSPSGEKLEVTEAVSHWLKICEMGGTGAERLSLKR